MLIGRSCRHRCIGSLSDIDLKALYPGPCKPTLREDIAPAFSASSDSSGRHKIITMADPPEPLFSSARGALLFDKV